MRCVSQRGVRRRLPLFREALTGVIDSPFNFPCAEKGIIRPLASPSFRQDEPLYCIYYTFTTPFQSYMGRAAPETLTADLLTISSTNAERITVYKGLGHLAYMLPGLFQAPHLFPPHSPIDTQIYRTTMSTSSNCTALVATERFADGSERANTIYKFQKPELLSVRSNSQTGRYTLTEHGSKSKSNAEGTVRKDHDANTTFMFVDMRKSANELIPYRNFDVDVRKNGYDIISFDPESTTSDPSLSKVVKASPP